MSAALLAGMALLGAAPATAAPVLEKVVLVARHGVRAPTSTTQALTAETGGAHWPAWPVGPGDLTSHGRAALAIMGEHLRGGYTAAGVLPGRGCAEGVAEIWADGQDRRTRESGEVLAQALSPACAIPVRHGPEGAPDPVFHAVAARVCPIDPQEALRAVEDAAGGDLVRPQERRALDAMQAVLDPEGCRSGGVCLAGESRLEAGEHGPRIKGPLGKAAPLAEDLLLEYAQGFPADQVGWGRAASLQVLASTMAVHDRQDELLRENPYLARHNGAVLVQTIMDLLQDRRPGAKGAPPLSPDARLVLLVGHDTNLSNLAGVFGLRWRLPGQPDPTAPDTVLAFERWRDAPGAPPWLRIVIYSQSLNALRTLPHEVEASALAASVCGSLSPCLIEASASRVRAILPTSCLQ